MQRFRTQSSLLASLEELKHPERPGPHFLMTTRVKLKWHVPPSSGPGTPCWLRRAFKFETITQVTKCKPCLEKKYRSRKPEIPLNSPVSAHGAPKVKMQHRALAHPWPCQLSWVGAGSRSPSIPCTPAAPSRAQNASHPLLLFLAFVLER